MYNRKAGPAGATQAAALLSVESALCNPISTSSATDEIKRIVNIEQWAQAAEAW